MPKICRESMNFNMAFLSVQDWLVIISLTMFSVQLRSYLKEKVAVPV
jgi:hypothetical protein